MPSGYVRVLNNFCQPIINPFRPKKLKISYSICIISLFLISCSENAKPLLEQISLNDGWEFCNSDSDQSIWHPANVPGTTHTDLLKNALIPDPFYGCNEKELQWIGKSDWSYRKTFQVSNDLITKPNIILVFEGLDTWAEVFLNRQKILAANNMFRKWEVDCREFLVEGENLIEVKFESAENRFLLDSIALGFPLPGGRWNFARKAAYHFGWDWGPKFVTTGIWKPVYIETWEKHRPLEIQLVTGQINSNKADIRTEFFVESAIDEKAILTVTDTATGKVFAKKELQLSPDLQQHEIEFSIEDPILWWSNGLGEPHLYELNFELKTNSGFFWSKHIPYGIRKIEVVNENDEHGQSLYLKLNDVPVFIKGANYIPQQSFVTEVSDEDYRKIVQSAVESNMNMLRVWGGGIYEKDIFYELCSRNGVLVWQDFMFACAMYPGDNDFVENVKQEATQQVRRLRNHTSLAMWCGNNEADEGWHNWQWQKTHKILPDDSATIWEGYQRIFHKLLPETVAVRDPGRFYLHTSPIHGWGRSESMTRGSAHYWGVWWGREPFEKYLEKVPRFMSEFGFQAMPAMATIRQFQPGEEDSLFSDALKCHQKHPTGYPTIDVYLERENLFPNSLEEYIYLSQLIQAKGIGMAIQAHRRAKPYCMGSLYWQLNDCWPVTSWSGMDVNGIWKALQYNIRNLYRDVLVSVIVREGTCEVWLVSDRLNEVSGIFNLSLLSFAGDKNLIINQKIDLKANSSTKVYSGEISRFIPENELNEWMIFAEFVDDTGQIFNNTEFLKSYGQLDLKPVSISKIITPDDGGYKISLNSDEFTAYLQLYLTDSHAYFDQNYIHLHPGEPKEVFCRTALSYEEFSSQLKLFSLNDYLERVRQEN